MAFWSFLLGGLVSSVTTCGVLLTDNPIKEYWTRINTTVFMNETGNAFHIPYYWNTRKYEVVVQKKYGSKESFIWEDSDGNDVTDTVNRYTGPYGDFHGIRTTPKMLGFPGGLRRFGASDGVIGTVFDSDDLL